MSTDPTDVFAGDVSDLTASVASQTPPEEYAKSSEVAAEARLPVRVVQGQEKTVRQKTRAERLRAFANRDKKLSRFVTRDVATAAFAQDQLEELAKLEALGERWGVDPATLEPDPGPPILPRRHQGREAGMIALSRALGSAPSDVSALLQGGGIKYHVTNKQIVSNNVDTEVVLHGLGLAEAPSAERIARGALKRSEAQALTERLESLELGDVGGFVVEVPGQIPQFIGGGLQRLKAGGVAFVGTEIAAIGAGRLGGPIASKVVRRFGRRFVVPAVGAGATFDFTFRQEVGAIHRSGLEGSPPDDRFPADDPARFAIAITAGSISGAFEALGQTLALRPATRGMAGGIRAASGRVFRRVASDPRLREILTGIAGEFSTETAQGFSAAIADQWILAVARSRGDLRSLITEGEGVEGQIAERFGTTPEQINALNGIDFSTNIDQAMDRFFSEEVLTQILREGAVGGFVGGTVSTVGVGGRAALGRVFGEGGPGGGMLAAERTNGAAQADAYMNEFEKAVTDLKKLGDRSEQTLADAIDTNAENGGVSEILVPAKALDLMFQSGAIDKDAFAAAVGEEVMDDFGSALSSGNDVEIPIGLYGARLIGTDMDTSLRPHIRIDPEADTKAEAAARQLEADRIADETSERAAEQVEEGADIEEQREAIVQSLAERMAAAAPQFKQRDVDAVAQVNAAVITTLAQRTGMQPQELFERVGAVTFQSFQGNPGVSTPQLQSSEQATAVPALQEELRARHPDADVTVLERNNGNLELSNLVIPKGLRKQGVGTAVMEDLIALADREGRTLELTPATKDPAFGTTSRGRLVRFYKRFGFVENKGRNKDFRMNADVMFRRPQAPSVQLQSGVGVEDALHPDRVSTRFQGGAEDSVARDARGLSEGDREFLNWEPNKTKDGKIKGAPEWVTNRRQFLRMRKVVRSLFTEGVAGRYWYEDSADSVLRSVGGNVVEAERIMQLYAIYSPQQQVPGNFTMAMRAYADWKSGKPKGEFRISTAARDKKAKELLYDGQPWEGRKTDSFYRNLMHKIVAEASQEEVAQLRLEQDLLERLKKPVTSDMWVFRAFGYERDGAGDDKSDGRYSFTENEISRITAETNLGLDENAEPWLPHQVQAALWTATKSRYNIDSVKDATRKESVRKGMSQYVKNEKGVPVWEAPNEKARIVKGKYAEKKPENISREKWLSFPSAQFSHRLVWRKHALAASAEDTAKAIESGAGSFADVMMRHVRSITWEANPSTALGHEINSASPRALEAFQTSAKNLIVDKDGIDQLAARLGVHIAWHEPGQGGYENVIAPNFVANLVPPKEEGAKGFERETVNSYARALQFIFKQDAVPWFRADVSIDPGKQYFVRKIGGSRALRRFQTQREAIDWMGAKFEKGQTELEVSSDGHQAGVQLNFSTPLSDQQVARFYDILREYLGSDAGFTRVDPNTIVVINFHDDGVPFLMDDEKFGAAIDRMGAERGQELGLEDAEDFFAEGDYGYFHDWGSDPSGDGVLSQKGLVGRQDLQTWLRSRRDVFEALIEAHSGEGLVELEALVGDPTSADRPIFLQSATPPQPVWYSKLLNVVTEKLPAKGTGNSYKATLESWAKKGQFKPEELEHSGALEWLETLDNQKITMEDVQDFIVQGGVLGRIRETHLRDKSDTRRAPAGQVFEGEAIWHESSQVDLEQLGSQARREVMEAEGVLDLTELGDAEIRTISRLIEDRKLELVEEIGQQQAESDLDVAIEALRAQLTEREIADAGRGLEANLEAQARLDGEVGFREQHTEQKTGWSFQVITEAGRVNPESIRILDDKGSVVRVVDISQMPIGNQRHRGIIETEETMLDQGVMLRDDSGRARHKQWALPGVFENYTETLLQIPDSYPVVEDLVTTQPDKSEQLFEVRHKNDPDGELLFTLLKQPNANGVMFWFATSEEAGVREKIHVFPGLKSLEDTVSFARDLVSRRRVFTVPLHFEEENIVAHYRWDERISSEDGSNVFFLEEIQSDWHAQGRAQGYRVALDTSKWKVTLNDRKVGGGLRERARWVVTDENDIVVVDFPESQADSAEAALAQAKAVRFGRSVPDAPFKKSWRLLAFKRALRQAIDSGADQIAWTTGEQQADRYDLRQFVSEIESQKSMNGDPPMVFVRDHDTNTIFAGEFDPLRGEITRVIEGPDDYLGKHVSEMVGESLADQLLAEPTTISGEGLAMGGEGLIDAYDKILPATVKKYVKRWGAEVGTTRIPTDELKRSVFVESELSIIRDLDADDVVTLRSRGQVEGMTDSAATFLLVPSQTGLTATRVQLASVPILVERGKRVVLAESIEGVEVHSVRINDAMREAVGSGQELFQGDDTGSPRGAFSPGSPGQASAIAIGATADFSTLVHESVGHYAIHVLGSLASDPTAPQQVKDDYAKLLEFAGVSEGNPLVDAREIGVAMADYRRAVESGDPDAIATAEAAVNHANRHAEILAQAAETYLREGKAPSVELRGAFRRFARWMRRIYENLQRLLGNELPADITEVFDRLIATDEEIERAKSTHGIEPMFATKPAHMTDAEWRSYREKVDDFDASAREQLLQDEARREKQIQARKRGTDRATMESVVRGRLSRSPIHQARQWLANGTWIGPEDEAPNIEHQRLDRTAIVEEFGAETERELPSLSNGVLAGTRRRRLKSRGIHHSTVAAMFGMTPSALIEGLKATPVFETAVRQETEAGMQQIAEGEVVVSDPGLDALHEDPTAALMVEEATALKRAQALTQAVRNAAERQVAEEGAGTAADRNQQVRDAREALRSAREALADAQNAPETGDLSELEQAVADAALSLETVQGVSEAARAVRRSDRARRREVSGLKVSQKAMRERAEADVRRIPLGRLRPHLYASSERRAAERSRRAAAQNDFEGAQRAKEDQLYNHFAYRAARKAQGRVEKIRRRARERTKTKRLDKVEGGGGREMRLHVQRIAAMSGLLTPAKTARFMDDQLRPAQDLVSWTEHLANEDGVHVSFEPEFISGALEQSDASRGKGGWKTMSLEQLEEIHLALQNLDHLGAEADKLRIGQIKTTRDEQRTKMIARAREVHGEPVIEGSVPLKPYGLEKTSEAAAGLHAWLIKMESFAVFLDGGVENGPNWQVFGKLARDAQHEENQLKDSWGEDINAIFDVFTPAELRELQKPQTRRETPSVGLLMTHAQRLAVGLNMGNEHNREAVRVGYGWTDEQLQDVLATLDDRDWQVIEQIWEMLEKRWPLIRDHEALMSGVQPGRVETDQFELRSGRKLKGGYYPLVGDPDFSDRIFKLDEKQDTSQMFGGAYAASQTRHGHAISRRGWNPNDQVLLDLNVLYQHMNNVAHDLAQRKFVVDTVKIIEHPDYKQMVLDVAGLEMFRTMREWVHTIAVDDPAPKDFISKLFRKSRIGSNVAIIGGSFSTTMVQWLGTVNAAVFTGFGNMAQGIKVMILEPRDSWDFIMERSKEMPARDRTRTREVADLMNSVKPTARLATAQRWSYAMVAMADLMVSGASWMAAYRQAMAGEVDGIDAGLEEQAIDYADRIVILSQGGGAKKDLARIQSDAKGGELIKQASVFYSFFSAQYAQLTELGFQRRFGNISKWDYVTRIAAGYVLVPLLQDMILGRAPDLEDEEDFVKWLGWAPVQNLASSVPLLSQTINVAARDFGDFSLGPTDRAFTELGMTLKALAQIPQEPDEKIEEFFTRGLGTIAMFVGIPGYIQLKRFMRAFNEHINGKEPTVKRWLFGSKK